MRLFSHAQFNRQHSLPCVRPMSRCFDCLIPLNIPSGALRIQERATEASVVRTSPQQWSCSRTPRGQSSGRPSDLFVTSRSIRHPVGRHATPLGACIATDHRSGPLISTPSYPAVSAFVYLSNPKRRTCTCFSSLSVRIAKMTALVPRYYEYVHPAPPSAPFFPIHSPAQVTSRLTILS